MADEITGLGFTDEENQDKEPLSGRIATLEAEASARHSYDFEMGSLAVQGGKLEHTTGGKVDFSAPLTGRGLTELSTYLDIPYKYVERIPMELREENFRWALGSTPDVRIHIETAGDHIQRIVHPDKTPTVELIDALKVVRRVVGANAEIKSTMFTNTKDIIDIVNPDIEIAPKRDTGDITQAGVRLVIPRTNQAPTVSPYLVRLVCTNGQTAVRPIDKLTVRDTSLSELLENMQEHLEFILNHRLPILMDGYRSMAEEEVTDPMHMIRVYGKENGLPDRYIKWLIADFEKFSEDNPSHRTTTYDITQMFSALAHHESVQSKPGTVMKLQGAAAGITEAVAEDCRCGQCKQLIPN